MRTMSDVNDYAKALNEAVGAELRKARRAADLTQEDVIVGTGLSKSTINRIENGTRDISTREIALITEVVREEPQHIMKRAQDRAAETMLLIAAAQSLEEETTRSDSPAK
jgi:transcriptional regulator with XRE-family HTH domain